MDITAKKLASYIEYTRVKGQDDMKEVKQACDKALYYNFGAVCVNPFFVSSAKKILSGSGIEVCTGIGYPLGAGLLDIKVKEIREVIRLGADAVDFVISIAAVKSGMMDVIENEMAALAIEGKDVITKAIIETCYLTDSEIFRVSQIVEQAGVNFVKTSTGMGSRGASLEDIRIIKEATKGRCSIKASGGIKTLDQALAFIEAGATRIGTSNGDEIMESFKQCF